MRRKFNYTGRRKIDRKRLDIHLDRDSSGVPLVSCKIDLRADEMPQESRVYLEAYSRSAVERLDCGTLAGLRPPSERRLPLLQGQPSIRFRVKVVDESGERGRMLAVADMVPATDPALRAENRLALLPVEPVELGQLVWRVSFEQDGPVLLVNRKIENIMRLASGDAAFRALVFPDAVSQVLRAVFAEAGEADPWGDPDDWQTRWLQFAMRFHGDEPPAGPDATGSECEEWIDSACGGFADWLHARDLYENASAQAAGR